MSATPLDLQVNMQALSSNQAKTQAMQNSFGANEALKSGQTAKKENLEKQSKIDQPGQSSDPNEVNDGNPDYVVDIENFDSDQGAGQGQPKRKKPLEILAPAQGSSELQVKAWHDQIGERVDIQA